MAPVPNPSLDTGLAALKQGNYPIAIAHFEGVCETEIDDSLIVRASKGLVMAYYRSGDPEKAIARCQSLTKHIDPKVREWATSTLSNLTGENLPSPRVNNFDLSNTRQELETVEPEGQANNPNSASTGFVAFDPTPSTPKTPPRRTPSKLKQPLTGSTKNLPPNSTTQDKQSNITPTQAPIPERSESVAEHSSQLLSPDSPPSTPQPALFTQWRNSGRAKDWRPLKPLKFIRLWVVEILSAIACFWVLRFVVEFAMRQTNIILVKLPFLRPIQLFYRNPTPALLIILGILLIASPWLIDLLLKRFYGLEPLRLSQLSSHSPEAGKVIQSLCRKHRIPIPKLGILPTNAPVALTYGNLPRTARIVVSEGLLALADDEIATIYTSQLAHIVHRDFILMSLGVLAIQLPYMVYWLLTQSGERLADLARSKFPSAQQILPPIILGITGVIASLSYGIYWILQLPLLWFSRARVYYSDRLAVETTGNPNGMTRALIKIALGITEDIRTTRLTSGLLESFDLMQPVGYRQAIILSSCSPLTPFEDVLTWDCTNRYRDWLSLSTSHPLLGERLAMLARYAQLWKLETELDLPLIAPATLNNAALVSKLTNIFKALPLLQSTLLAGLILGSLLRAILWVIGKISDQLNVWQLIWLHNADPFLNACIMIVFSLCVFAWINRYFPDIKPTTFRTEPDLGDSFANPARVPADSQPLQLTGNLLGRRGLLNWLGQDLILQTSTGLVRLHYSSYLGPFGNLLPQRTRPSDLVEQQVTVTGWLRRGATPWLDVETLRATGKVVQAQYPIWLTVLAFVAAVWGAYSIWEA
jgi:Zn-dependent protease with chaperone function